MYETELTLDFFGILWYHKRVKLGCNATVPHGFDRLISGRNRGSPLPHRVTGTGSSCFEKESPTEFCLFCLSMRLAVFG